MKKLLLILLLVVNACKQKEVPDTRAGGIRVQIFGKSAWPDVIYFTYNDKIYDSAVNPNKIQRVWCLSDFGIYPNTGECFTKRVQQLIDSAYFLPGKTQIKLDSGEYHFSAHFDMNKDRQDIWVQFDMTGNSYSAIIKCSDKQIYEEKLKEFKIEFLDEGPSSINFYTEETANVIMRIYDDGSVEIYGDTLTVLKQVLRDLLITKKELNETNEANRLREYYKPEKLKL